MSRNVFARSVLGHWPAYTVLACEYATDSNRLKLVAKPVSVLPSHKRVSLSRQFAADCRTTAPATSGSGLIRPQAPSSLAAGWGGLNLQPKRTLVQA